MSSQMLARTPSLTIAGLARAGGVGVETVRYYQRRGLIETPRRHNGAGRGGAIRHYGDAHVRRLRFIRAAQAAGFTLEQIGELLALDASHDRDRDRARALAQEQIAALDARIAALEEARAALHKLARACGEGDAGRCPILTAFDS
ncbi:MerR family DNA-binding protein [Novosphingobium pokkalii]|uniref:MerR family DNA-binding protein n=1 Tax=Novosphingobium pokkalii TaxID=1770194 RepID=A0ABV7V016_9SPHN|nr:MerR family DNA-binding protein [Novosphingobium pokkalii]GHC84247.1 MerR family transcriptional regulator [Novosphingobium pokkalii]